MVKVSDLFEVKYGHSLELNRLTIVKPGCGIAFVSRKMGDNGISAYVEPIQGVEPAPAGYLSCALGGNGVLTTHLQEQPFYVGRDVALLNPRKILTKAQLLYYCLCIKTNRFRYSYGRQANRTLKDLPIPDFGDFPSWVDEVDVGMFDGADSAARLEAPSAGLERITWKLFRLNELFELKKGKRLTKAEIRTRPGPVPFIGAIDSNNGVAGSVDAAIHAAGTLTVNYNGAGVADAFYQPIPFWASDDVNVLYPKFVMSLEVGLFIATIIRQEKYRFSYGRKWHLERMRDSEIHLPANAKGQPDWAFMDEYIRSLPFSGRISGSSTSRASTDNRAGDNIEKPVLT